MPDRLPTDLLRAILIVLTMLLVPCVSAQEAGAAGGIRIVVIDEDFQEPVGSAAVLIEGANRRAETDRDGRAVFVDLAPGSYRVSVTREGFVQGRSDSIPVRAGEISESVVRLTADVVGLDEFVVTAEDLIDPPMLQALEVRQSAASFTDVLGADFISKIGASDAGKALQKTAGVSLAGDRYIVVRGLADRYNAVLLNGTPVPSSDPDKRAVNIDLFPASIIQSLETNKTFVPGLPGEGTGATINIVSKGIPEKSGVKVKVGTAYNTLTTGSDRFRYYQGGGTGMLGTLEDRRLPAFIRNGIPPPRATPIGPDGDAIRRIADEADRKLPRTMGTTTGTAPWPFATEITINQRGEFWGAPAGVMAALDYRKSYAADPQGFQGRYTFGAGGVPNGILRELNVDAGRETLRATGILAGGIQPRPGEELKLTLFTNLSAEDRATLRTGNGRSPFPIPPNSTPDFLYRESLAYTERFLGALQFSGNLIFGDVDDEKAPKFNWAATYSESSQDEPDHRFVEMLSNPSLTFYSFPGSFSIPPYRRYWRSLKDDRYNIMLDYEQLLFGDSDRGITFQAGGSFDYATRRYDADSFAYNAFATGIESKTFTSPGQKFGDVLLYGNPPISSFANIEDSIYLFRFTPSEFYDATQTIPGLYFNVKGDLSENLGFAVGFRIEQTVIKVRASDFVDLAEDEYKLLFLTPEERNDNELRQLLLLPANINKARQDPRLQARRNANLTETHILPALSGNWDMSDTMRLRGSFSRTIARPSFKEMAPVIIRDAETSDVFLGNPDLEVSDISNYDLRWEWTPKPEVLCAISVFSKTITDTIEKSFGNGVEQYFNTGTANVYGFELEADASLAFLAEELRHFSIGANYSFINSLVDPSSGVGSAATRRLQGQPDYLFNFNLSFDHEDTGISAGLFMNVTGQYLDAVGNSGTPDVYVRPMTSLDAMLSFRVFDEGKLTFRAANLTNQKLEKYFEAFSEPIHTISSRGVTFSMSYEQAW